jgi:RNA polymerase sigma factor (sigma-70 family)
MESESDIDLLKRFANDDAEEAFSELVQRHVDLVFTAARRQVGSPQLAEEIAQSVFAELAKLARSRVPDIPLAAWLHTVTRRRSIDAIRRESRRRAREQAAMELAATNSGSDATWASVEPHLDEALEALPAADRSAILLRFFEGRSLREVGEALGSSEDAAQKRVSRALEQIRGFLGRRGVTVGSGALAADLAANAVEAAPLALGAAISTGALTGGAASAAALTLAMTTTQKVLIATAMVAALGAGIYQNRLVQLERSRVAELELAVADARQREQVLRADRDELLQRIEAAPALAPADESPENGNPAAPYLATISRVKEWIESLPEMSIPEMGLLSDVDLMVLAGDKPPSTSAEARELIAQLRIKAREKFTPLLLTALATYVATHQGMLPADVSELSDYFRPAIDPAILARYRMLQSGTASEVGGREVIGERHDAMIDDTYDVQFWYTLTGVRATAVTRQERFQQALERFAAENAGRRPVLPEELNAFLEHPMEAEVLRQLFAANQN